MFVKAQEHRYRKESHEWYLVPCFFDLTKVTFVRFVNHLELGLCLEVFIRGFNGRLYLKHQRDSSFPACVEARW